MFHRCCFDPTKHWRSYLLAVETLFKVNKRLKIKSNNPMKATNSKNCKFETASLTWTPWNESSSYMARLPYTWIQMNRHVSNLLEIHSKQVFCDKSPRFISLQLPSVWVLINCSYNMSEWCTSKQLPTHYFFFLLIVMVYIDSCVWGRIKICVNGFIFLVIMAKKNFF